MNNNTITKGLCIGLSTAALSFGIATSAQAQSLLYSTTFNAPTYTDGALNSGADTTTPGQDGWLTSSGGATNTINVSNSATNGLVTLTTSGQDVRHQFTGVTSGSVYLRADITVTSAQATGDYFLHLTDGSATNFYARTYIKLSGAGFVMALGTGAGTATYGTTVLNLNTTYTLLVRYDIVPGTANDTGALYINPTSATGATDTAYVAATTIGTDATTIGAVALRQGSATAAPGLTVDNISVSAAVPEPATYAWVVGGIGALALGMRRRRVA